MVFGIILTTVLALWLSTAYNTIVRLKNTVDEAYATMDVHLEKRYDLVPNLVNVVKGSSVHEEETLTRVMEARNAAWNPGSWEGKMQMEGELTNALKSLFAVAEAYPELQANKNFMKLQDQLNGIEDDIANARKYYNAVVKTYNTKVQSFPTMIYAKMLHFKKRPFFEVSDESKRENVKVEF